MNYQELAAKIETVVQAHLSEYGEEEMIMPYPMHWVMAVSIGDAAQDHYMVIRAVTPSTQPRYVSTGLLHESIEMINWGETQDEEE